MAKTALLTGCGSGIGLVAAERFAEEGWNVAATARNPAVLGELAGRHLNVLPLRLDVTDEELIREGVAAAFLQLKINGRCYLPLRLFRDARLPVDTIFG